MIDLGVPPPKPMECCAPVACCPPPPKESYPCIYVGDEHAKLMGIAALKSDTEYEVTFRVKRRSLDTHESEGRKDISGILEICAMGDWQTDEPPAKNSTERATASVMGGY